MKVTIDFTLNAEYLVREDGGPKSEHLMQWLGIHDGFIETELPALPLLGDRLDIITENKTKLTCVVIKRRFTTSVRPSFDEIPVTVYAEIAEPERIKDSLINDAAGVEAMKDILQKDFLSYLKNHESSATATRLKNALEMADIRMFADVCQYTHKEVSRFKNVGPQAVHLLEVILAHKGLRLGMDVAKYGIKPSPKII